VQLRATSIGNLPVGMHSLAVQMTPEARAVFRAEDLVPVLIDAHDARAVSTSIEAWQGRVTPISQNTLVAMLPRTRLNDLARLASVRYVEASNQLRPHCDLAHLSTGLFRRQGQTRKREVKQTGAGVLIGVVDSGIDAAHPAFQKPGGGTRIVLYLDQTPKKGGPISYDSKQIDKGAAAASPDSVGHGTHVAGIAAGNGGGSPGEIYQGVAPEADLAIVKTDFQSGSIITGIKALFQLAEERGQPCVINLSLGGHYGGHDGTSVVERTIDQLSGRGRMVVASAGNEGDDPIHAGIVLPRGNPSAARWVANFSLRPRMVDGQLIGQLFVQVWHQREDDLIIRLRAPNGESFTAPANGQKPFDRSSFFVDASHQVAVYSGDNTTTFGIAALPMDQWLNGWSIVVEEDRGRGKRGVVVGSVHAWILDQEMGRFTSGHTADHLVGMPGTAFSAITVAAYATRAQWASRDPKMPKVDLNAIHLEDIAYFSSPGPTRDGDTKPELAAPGQWLISALSDKASDEEVPTWTRLAGVEYAAMQGTSMAAPYVTGALALLLEKDKTIDWAEAKRRLIKSARQDEHSASCWNARWGHGKLDIQRLLEIEPS
jgi:subtilisin family serine protease